MTGQALPVAVGIGHAAPEFRLHDVARQPRREVERHRVPALRIPLRGAVDLVAVHAHHRAFAALGFALGFVRVQPPRPRIRARLAPAALLRVVAVVLATHGDAPQAGGDLAQLLLHPLRLPAQVLPHPHGPQHPSRPRQRAEVLILALAVVSRGIGIPPRPLRIAEIPVQAVPDAVHHRRAIALLQFDELLAAAHQPQ